MRNMRYNSFTRMPVMAYIALAKKHEAPSFNREAHRFNKASYSASFVHRPGDLQPRTGG